MVQWSMIPTRWNPRGEGLFWYLQSRSIVATRKLGPANRCLHIFTDISVYDNFESNICIFLPIFEIGITSCMSRTCGCHPPFAYFHRELLWRMGAFATPRKLRDPLLIKIMASSTLNENKTQIVEVDHVTNFVMGFFYITLSFCYSVCPLSISINSWP